MTTCPRALQADPFIKDKYKRTALDVARGKFCAESDYQRLQQKLLVRERCGKGCVSPLACNEAAFEPWLTCATLKPVYFALSCCSSFGWLCWATDGGSSRRGHDQVRGRRTRCEKDHTCRGNGTACVGVFLVSVRVGSIGRLRTKRPDQLSCLSVVCVWQSVDPAFPWEYHASAE